MFKFIGGLCLSAGAFGLYTPSTCQPTGLPSEVAVLPLCCNAKASFLNLRLGVAERVVGDGGVATWLRESTEGCRVRVEAERY